MSDLKRLSERKYHLILSPNELRVLIGAVGCCIGTNGFKGMTFSSKIDAKGMDEKEFGEINYKIYQSLISMREELNNGEE
jgi:hypothetical protein